MHTELGAPLFSGKDSFIWLGPNPTVNIVNPELIKEILNKYNDYQKPASNPLVKLLADGLVGHEGEKWVTYRKIMNPAFHIEKLKVTHLKSNRTTLSH